ncbi:hypothetical protein GCM10027413_19850 [Conyzicola nivalis]|uniref:Uncharacterized protein n=1 Tax=Conyzicola nivalis TaxID=1477021 RepID=A0A916WGG6_9MICO|nr:hypothetical protein [Conyzicola nivalis]GGA94930.1 hypothetical protein GCM10010979_06770 [Conyzicola nivalis]
MTTSQAASAYEDVAFSFEDDARVVVNENQLYVDGTIFAFLDNDDLVVELSESRVDDLAQRGVAARFTSHHHPARNWIRVADQQLWPELARESHAFVGEPAVGGES